jgi:hypothetical protein
MEVMDILGKQVRYGAAVPDLANYSLCVMDLKNERSYLRDLDRFLRTVTDRTESVGTADFIRHET